MEVMMLKSCLGRLEDSLNELSKQLEQAPALFAANKPGPFSYGDEALAIIRHGITDLYYEEGTLDGRFTPICLGAVAATPEILQQVAIVNQNKDSLHIECRRYLDNALLMNKEVLKSAAKAKRLRAMLTEIGYGRLSLRQCYRHLHVLGQPPQSIRFSYSTGGSSIRKLTPAKALDLIEKSGMDSDSADIARKTLEKLPPNTPLAQVQRLAGYYKANMVYDSVIADCMNETDVLVDVQHAPLLAPPTVPAFLPIFYPHDPEKNVISQLTLPPSDIGRHRKVRADKKLQDDPIIKPLRVYTYEQINKPKRI